MSCLQNFVFLFICCVLAIVQNGKGDVFGSFDMDKTFGTDEVRCYCNMAECITTGYMCKSQKLGCFSDLAAVTSPSSIEMVTHGCLDLLDKSLQTTCRNLPGKSDSASSSLDSGAPKSLLLCCTEDMCNDVDIPGNRLDLSNQVFNVSDPLYTVKSAGKLRRPNLTFDTELFFRLATFAVPLLGAMILFMLVTLAIKLLRSDADEDRMVAMKLRQNDAASMLLNKRNFPNGSCNLNDFEASSKKVPLLYQYDRTHLPPASYLGNRVNLLYPILTGHHVEKNKTNAKLNNVSAPYNTPGSSLDQPLLKINSGTHLQQANILGPMPLYNGWGGVVTSNNLGQTFCGDASNVSAALNQFVSNVGGCRLNVPQNAVDNLSTSVNIGENGSCCSAGLSGNVDGTMLKNVATTSDVNVTADAGGEKVCETLGCVGTTSSANPGNVSTTNGSTSLNVADTTSSIDETSTDATSGNTVATLGFATETSATSPGFAAETSATCCNHLGTSKTNLPFSGCIAPSNRTPPNMSPNARMSTNSSPNHHAHSIPCPSSFMGVGTSNVPIPTVFGPFACVTTQATSDEHPIYSLQKSSEHPICSLNKLPPSCDCCSGCSSKCFEKSFGSHGCNLCQGSCNGRLVASNSSTAACNNFDSEDDTKLNYKKNLMPPFCTS